MKTVLALRHVAYEDLDGFEAAFEEAGFEIIYRDALFDEGPIDALSPDIMVVLGSPTAVYESGWFSFIEEELSAIKARIEANKPVLGLCFGRSEEHTSQLQSHSDNSYAGFCLKKKKKKKQNKRMKSS